jgi:hypothetical protein
MRSPKNLITECGMTFSNIWACDWWTEGPWFYWRTEDGEILEAEFIGWFGEDILVRIL